MLEKNPIKISVNDAKKNTNRILSKTENMYGYRKKKVVKKPPAKLNESINQSKTSTEVVSQSIEFERKNEQKREFYRKIGTLVEVDSTNFNSKNEHKNRKTKMSKKNREKINQSERNVTQKAQKYQRNFQSGGVIKKQSNNPRFKTRTVNNIKKQDVKKDNKKKRETAEERRERIRAYKKMRFVGLKSKKKKLNVSKPEFGTMKMKKNNLNASEVSKTTPINLVQSQYVKNDHIIVAESILIAKKNTIKVNTQDNDKNENYNNENDNNDKENNTSIKNENMNSSLSKDLNNESAQKLKPENDTMSEIEKQKEKIKKMTKEEINIEIQSCRIERDLDKMMFETGSAKNVDLEVQNEISVDQNIIGMKFPGGARSPSDLSNDFRSESTSKMQMFEDVPMSMNSTENHFNIDDIRNFHKKGKNQIPNKKKEIIKIQSVQDNILYEKRRLTMKESSASSVNKFKKNYSNAHLQKRNNVKEDFLDPKFDSAIPRITRMIQGKGGMNLQGEESLEFLLTSNVEKPKAKMLDIKELTNDMDMIINGIDSIILSRQQGQTMRSQLSEANNFEYSDTNVLKTTSKLTNVLKTETKDVNVKEITNLIQDDQPKFISKVLNDSELKKMKEELNLKANTQEMREYLSHEGSTIITQSHPFLESEPDRSELRKSLEKYAANLERIEEESNVLTKESSYKKETALKMNEDPFEESIKFELTKESSRKNQKPPMKRYELELS